MDDCGNKGQATLETVIVIGISASLIVIISHLLIGAWKIAWCEYSLFEATYQATVGERRKSGLDPVRIRRSGKQVKGSAYCGTQKRDLTLYRL